MESTNLTVQKDRKNFTFRNLFLTGAVAAMTLTACKKENTVVEKSLDQQKIEFQQRQLEIEQQKLAIEK